MLKRLQTLWQTLKSVSAKVTPSGKLGHALLVAGGMVALSVMAFFLGQRTGLGRADADPPIQTLSVLDQGMSPEIPSIVAYIYGNIPVTRDELGMYLVERFGKERTEYLVNRKIVEMACRNRGIVVTNAEIEAQIDVDLQSMGAGLTRKDFENHILHRFKKTMFEWREDVVRPKLLLAKLVKPTIVVTEEDMTKAFEARFHEQVKVRLIVFQTKDKHAEDVWHRVKDDEVAFKEEAKKQFLPNLQANGGEVPPIHKHFGDPRIEKEAFGLQDGQVSALIEMPDKSCVILKRDGIVPRNDKVAMDQVRAKLYQDIADFKLAMAIPQYFNKLREEARPQIFLRNDIVRQDRMEHEAQQQINPQTRQVMHQTIQPSTGPVVPRDGAQQEPILKFGTSAPEKKSEPASEFHVEPPPPLPKGEATPAKLPALGTNPAVAPAPAVSPPPSPAPKS
jgi:hypothetical protein